MHFYASINNKCKFFCPKTEGDEHEHNPKWSFQDSISL